ncbi:MAG: hypothetical protein ACM362_10930 [Candidatus Methylomirabilota bacterium]
MRSPKRNLILLIALVGIWGLVFAFRSPRATEPRREVRAGAGRSARVPAAQGGGLPRLKTGLLDLPRPAYPPVVQNIFGTPPPPPRPPQAAVLPPAPPPPDPFQEEGKRLRYVGFLDAGKAKLAFIVQGKEVHTVEVGATFSSLFRVQAITEDAVLLSSPDGAKQIRLPLASDAGSRPPPGPGAPGRPEGHRP